MIVVLKSVHLLAGYGVVVNNSLDLSDSFNFQKISMLSKTLKSTIVVRESRIILVQLFPHV